MNPTPIEPSSIAQPAKCKLCGATVGHFALSWPADTPFNQAEFGRLFKAVTQHMQKHAQAGDKKHQGALMHAAAIGGNLTQVFIARHFTLPEAADGYLEQCRGSVNHMTSKFTLTPENAKQIGDHIAREISNHHNFSGAIGADEVREDISGLIQEAMLAIAARYEEGHPTPENQQVN